MKRLIFVVTIALLLIGFKTLYELKLDSNKVLGEKISISPSPTASPSASPVPTLETTPSPTPSPTEKPTITPIPVPLPTFTSQQIYEYIEKFAGQYGVSADILRHIAVCESGFNHMAKNLNYGGLYQFGPSTWKNIRISMGEETDANLRFNAEEAVQTAAYVLKENKAYIWPNCLP